MKRVIWIGPPLRGLNYGMTGTTDDLGTRFTGVWFKSDDKDFGYRMVDRNNLYTLDED